MAQGRGQSQCDLLPVTSERQVWLNIQKELGSLASAAFQVCTVKSLQVQMGESHCASSVWNNIVKCLGQD